MDFHLLNEVVMPWRVIVTRAEAGLCVADSLREPDTAGVTVLMQHPCTQPDLESPNAIRPDYQAEGQAGD